ncbi:peptidoglycan-binding protein [Photobacterium damselae subsp. damselae]|uniref:peptidoglycan-binding protein n=1 Tax=Photobacterium damselae TaxID=38293 RepID=UPI001F486EFD|nr:peptidoglycan-binding protein [Photobacterium damselae]UKA23366.1 peptidoglycan-binding protein [Photobacterium damselae subsp. damselae]
MYQYIEIFSTDACLSRISASLFKGEISEEEKIGIKSYINAYFFFKEKGYVIPVSYLSYILATVYHETDKHMQSLREYGKGKGKKYGRPDSETGHIYYGRGDVQVTWKSNYAKLSEMIFNKEGGLGVDLVNNPDLLLDPFYSTQATIFGMVTGLYTGKRLRDYLWGENPDYINARRIINGTDDAAMIAGYAHEFNTAIRLGMHRSIKRVVLSNGSRGDDVRELQLMLNLEPDGVFGKDTRKAVMSFQINHDLLDDGVVGFDTWKELEQAIYWSKCETYIDSCAAA